MKTQEELARYIAYNGALDYTPDMVRCDPSRQDEISYIANYLCGFANERIAINYMNGFTQYEEAFLDNVSYNSIESVPVIVRAIQIHLQNKR